MNSPALELRWPDQATVVELPPGALGTRFTLETLARLVREAKVDPQLRIRNAALRIVAGVPRSDFVETLQQWVQDNIQYVPDIRGIETVTAPVFMLAQRAGDCDDHSLLINSLLECIGFKTRFVGIGPVVGIFKHVYPEVKLGTRWIACETTKPWPLGRAPQHPPGVPPMIVHV